MKENNNELILDDKVLKKAFKKAKLLSIIRTVIIVIMVSIPLYFAFTNINTRVTYSIGTKYYEDIKKELEITNPKAYISKVNDIIGFFGASGRYTVSKEIGFRRNIELYEEYSRYGLAFGVAPNRVLMFESKGSMHRAGEWPVSTDKSGNLKMMAFHPDIVYKEYKDDLALLEKLSPDSLLEMTLSLDKKYKADEILEVLPDANISELLLDAYTDEQMNKYSEEAAKYDPKSSFIWEYDFVRLGVSALFEHEPVSDVAECYEKLLENLQYDFVSSYHRDRFRSIYSVLESKGHLEGEDIDIIGVIVYGSPEELMKLRDNPYVKASSAGIVTRDIIFK